MSKYVVMCGWDEVPHLSSEQKRDMLASIPPFQRDARSKGIPQLGAGAIYPVPETEIVVDDFVIPSDWPRAYGIDVGWNFTAWAKWTRNPASGIFYLYEARKVSNMRPSEVVRLLEASDGRIRGAIDPAARGRGQSDGEQLLQQYRDLGADVVTANNAVEAGIYEVWQRLVSGRVKLLKLAARELLSEYRVYRRDEKGKVVKVNDHLMDAMRYGVMTFMVDGALMTQPVRQMTREEASMWGARQSGDAVRRNPMTMEYGA